MTEKEIRILIAPDKFKGSLTAREVGENIAKGLGDVLSDARIEIVPMADGGDGTAEVICDALGGSWLKCHAHDPLGRDIEAHYAWIGKQKLAVMEMSEAAGMRRLKEKESDVAVANTFGVGEMVLDAARREVLEIIIGLGGSATNDGGFGMARALGFRFTGANQQKIEKVVDLIALEHIERPKQLSLPKIVGAADVKNPLLGENGATRVFGPQKGARENEIAILERALAKLADVVSKEFDVDYRDEPGAGAAGGLGFGLMSFCDAKIRPGFDVVAEAVELESRVKDVDLVITGEGSLDQQTLEGKTPAGVARIARQLGKRVFAIVGHADKNREVRALFDDVYELGGGIAQARELLQKRACELANRLKKTPNVQRPMKRKL